MPKELKIWGGIMILGVLIWITLMVILIFFGVGVPDCDISCEARNERAKDFQKGRWVTYESLPDGTPCFIRVTQWAFGNGEPMNTETVCSK